MYKKTHGKNGKNGKSFATYATYATEKNQYIYRDKSHPRFMELYHRWRAQLSAPDPYKQFLPFIRTVLASEKSPN